MEVRGNFVFVADNRWNPYHDGEPVAGGNYGGIHVFDILVPRAPVRRSVFKGSDTQDESRFGNSVAVDGSLLVAGAPHQDSQIGAAYLFEISYRGQAAECYKIVDSERVVGAKFGTSADIEGNLVLVGAAGKAFLFDISDPDFFVERSKLLPPAGYEGGGFGASVSLSGNLAIIGSPMGTADEGYAFVFDISDPTDPDHLYTLSATADASTNNEFGQTVAIEGTIALVGAPFRDDVNAGADTGAVYVFNLSNPSALQGTQFVANDRTSGDQFGQSIALEGDLAIVGGGGAGYRFDISNTAAPIQTGKLTPAAPYTPVGSQVAADGKVALLGRIGTGASQPSVGLFSISDVPPLVAVPRYVVLSRAIDSTSRKLKQLRKKSKKARRIAQPGKRKKKTRKLANLSRKLNARLRSLGVAFAAETGATYHP